MSFVSMYIVVTTPHMQAIASFHCPMDTVATVPVHPNSAALSVILIYRKKICALRLFFARASARAKN